MIDISSLRERENAQTFSVTELNNYIKNLFEGNRTLSSVTVRGEISNFTNHRTGHLYFSLKDEEGQVRAVMFRSRAMALKFIPESGMRVIVHGSVTVYSRDGSYQIYVNSMQPDGIGALYLAYEQLKEKLSGEGLFDQEHKKPLPTYPSAVGVITSPTGAAVRDIINVISRRFPLAKIYLYPALVQGDGAVESLINGLDYFDRSVLAEVIIIGRGGGSIEDLWAFNSEKLARKIFETKIPVISAVGHQTDFTIADFVSDLRAPTPSAAAELAVPDTKELLLHIDNLTELLSRSLVRKLERASEHFQRLSGELSSDKMNLRIGLLSNTLGVLSERAVRSGNFALESAKNSLLISTGKLESLNPLKVLTRGYSITECRGVTVKSVSEIEKGDKLSVRLADGSAEVFVEEVFKEIL